MQSIVVTFKASDLQTLPSMKISPIKKSLLDSPSSTTRRFDAVLSSFEMRKEEIEDIKLFIRRTSVEVLDCTKTYTQQPNVIPKIVNAIRAKYSELFSGNTEPSRTCLALALKYVRYYFNNHRKGIKDKARKTLMQSHWGASPSSKFSDRFSADKSQKTSQKTSHGQGSKLIRHTSPLFPSSFSSKSKMKCDNRTQQTSSNPLFSHGLGNVLADGILESPDLFQHDVGTLSPMPTENRFIWPTDSVSGSGTAGSGHPVFTPAQPTKRFHPHNQGQSDTSSNFKRSSFFPAEMTPRKAFLVVPLNSPASVHETSDNELSSIDTVVHRPPSDLLRKSPSNPSKSLFPSTLSRDDRSHASHEWLRPSTERTLSPYTTSMAQTETPEERDNFLYHFLESCPTHDMTRLYSALAHVDLTQTYIRVMGTTWTVDQIQNFLRRIFAFTCDEDGAVIPDIDIIFLAHHFINYFSRGGSHT